MYFAVTNLRDLPTYASLLSFSPDGGGNTLNSDVAVRYYFGLGIYTETPFNVGDIVEFSFSTTITNSNYFRIYCRGSDSANPTAAGSGHEGRWEWVSTEGGTNVPIGDANNPFGIRFTDTVICKVRCIAENTRAFIIWGGSTKSVTGSAANLTGGVTFNYLYGNKPVDPYEQLDIPISTTGGGPSSPSNPIGYDGIINDDIDFPDTPTASAANANFISIWTPTLDQVQDLAKWMWTTDPLRWEFWQKLLQNPLELIFSLTIMPIPIYHTDESGTPAEDEIVASSDVLCLGWQDTGIMMDWITDQYITLDMGSIDIEEVWGAFLDYEPYTKIDIFLPYIGMKTLDTNDCMPRTISLKYKIDLATGTCLALIKCDNSVYYHFSGKCASQIPITVNQCQEIVRGLMTMAVGAATLVAGGAGVAAAGETTAISGLATTGGAAMMGRGADNAAKGVSVSRSGTICCAAGLMDVQTPYLVISRPRQALPEEQNKYTGYPSFITEQIGDLEGYTEVQIIHLENMTCTDEEYQEIDTLLLGGVII